MGQRRRLHRAPPNNDVPPPTWREAVRYIERRGGIRKLSNLYAKRAVAGGENSNDIDRAFTPPDLRGYYTDGKEVNTEWYTPAALFTALNCFFDLDPASPGAELVPWIPAAQHYTRLDDGLTKPWFGFVFCNPPYGRSCLSKWVQKFVEHGNGIILVSDRTSTRWYQELLTHADLILMLRKKLRFDNGTDNMRQFPIGTHLVANGPKGVEALINGYHNGLGSLVKPYWPDARVRGAA